MHSGVPLTDADRAPWLQQLASILHSEVAKGRSVVLACSALKPAYRAVLRTLPPLSYSTKANTRVDDSCNTFMAKQTNIAILEAQTYNRIIFVHLAGSLDLFKKRTLEREEQGHHYMPSSLLKSQIDTLQIGDNEEGVIRVDAAKYPVEILNDIIDFFGKKSKWIQK